MRKVKFLYILVITLFAFIVSLFFIKNKLISKYLDLAYRFRLIESKLESYGKSLVYNIEEYQNLRTLKKNISEINNEFIFDWNKIKVPWDKSKYNRIKAITVWEGNLVVGLYALEKQDTLPIFLYDKKKWVHLGENIKKTNNDKKKFQNVHVLHIHNEKLYAGIDGSVWSFDKNFWEKEKIEFGKKNISLSNEISAYSMESHKGYLYLGLLDNKKKSLANIFRFKNSKWEKIEFGINGELVDGIYELFSHTDGRLYASTISRSYNGASLYQLNLSQSLWKKIGGNGINGSWLNRGFSYGLSITSHNDYLVLTLNRNPITYGNFSSIWMYNGTEWFVAGNNKPPLIWGEVDNFNASISFKGLLIIGAGGKPAGNATIWALNRNKWELVGGRGKNNSWGENYPHSLTKDFRKSSSEHPYKFIKWDNTMVVGFGDAKNASVLWQLNIYDK